MEKLTTAELLKARTSLIALVGNPNSGKTTLFNSLTHSQQRVGNYPGVTVEKISGTYRFENQTYEVTDVPGLYSLKAISADESVAADVVLGRTERKPDLLVCVIDCSNLERNLFVLSQIAEGNIPVLVALTMGDLVAKSGAYVDVKKLEELLGVDVIPVVAHKGIGLDAFKSAVERNLNQSKFPLREFGFPEELEAQVDLLTDKLARSGIDSIRTEVREAISSDENRLARSVKGLPELEEALASARQSLGEQGIVKPGMEETYRYQWAGRVSKQVIPDLIAHRARTLSDKIDGVLTHRFFGLIIFAAIMFLVFQSIYTFAQPVMGWIDAGFKWIGALAGKQLSSIPWLSSLVRDGLIGGVGAIMSFLPQIAILFFFIAVLEGTGYLSRAAFLMDRLLGWCGLNGRAFIPLLSSFACAIPGIMAARVMPDARSRLATILVAPLMSCSARLPVYVLLIGAFVEPKMGPVWAAVALFAMHLVGLAVAIPVVWILNRGVIRGQRLPFLLELPTYQWPKWRDVWLTVFSRAKVFVQTAGTIIVVMSIVIWSLLYFPRSESDDAAYRSAYQQLSAEARSHNSADNYVLERQTENSYLGRFGKFIEPAFRPAGFDWRLSTGILAAFPARETVVSTLGIIFSLGGEVDEKSGDLRGALTNAQWPDGKKLIDPWTAFGFMVFFALCCQCMATLATVKRETNSWKWPVFMFSYMTILAYLAAVLIHQVGLRV